MFSSPITLSGKVVVEGVSFRWAVSEGLSQHLTVSHRILGTETQQLTQSPQEQARAIGRAMLEARRADGHE
jgi:hypothetical protein